MEGSEYKCACGKTFVTSQAKAGHCHYCAVYRAAQQEKRKAMLQQLGGTPPPRYSSARYTEALKDENGHGDAAVGDDKKAQQLRVAERARQQLCRDRDALNAKIADVAALEASLRGAVAPDTVPTSLPEPLQGLASTEALLSETHTPSPTTASLPAIAPQHH